MKHVTPFDGGHGKRVVYDTYAAGGRIHFDVFVPESPDAAAELHAARQAAQLFMAHLKDAGLILAPADATLTKCARCHVDDIASYGTELWSLVDQPDIYIWPIAGCPKPGG